MSSLSYGRLESADDEDRLAASTAASFNATRDDVERWWDKAGRDNLRVVRCDGRTIGGLLAVSMGQFFGGRSIRSAGVAGVTVAPEERGRGAARFLMTEALREFRGRGEPLSVLYASTFSLYRSAGYERAGSYYRARMRARDLPRERPALRVRPATDDDAALIESLARERARASDGMADRGPYLWQRHRDPRGFVARCYVVEGDEPEGHVILHTPESGLETIHLADWSARTPGALQTVRAFVAEHGTMWDELAFYPSAGDPLLFSILEKGARIDVREFWMLRIADVPAALAGRGYPPGMRAEVSLDVTDEGIAENHGPWTLRVADGRGEVTPGGAGRVRLDVATLAPLFSGFVRAEDLALTGRLEGSAEDLAVASAVFAGQGASMVDFF